jgi:hypothetical protein
MNARATCISSGHLVDWKNIGLPHREQKARLAPGLDSYQLGSADPGSSEN